jgi:hypothetical protein
VLRPIRRHTKDCAKYGDWDVDCPAKQKKKCPLIIVRYEQGPSGRKIRKEQSLGTSDLEVAWQLIAKMVTTGETKPKEPPKTVEQSIATFLTLEAGRGIAESTLRSFRKFLRGNPKRNPHGDYSVTLLKFAAEHEIEYLQDFTPELVATWEGSWTINGRALEAQHERMKHFFKYCHESKWIPENPAAKLRRPKVHKEPVYAFPKEDRVALLKAVADNPFLLTVNLTLFHTGLAPVDLVFLKPVNLHQDRIVTKRRKTGKRVNVKIPAMLVERLQNLPVQNGGYWFWNRKEGESKHETATGNLRRMLRPYFDAAKVYQRDEHGEVVLDENNEPLLGHLYQWRHTFVHMHIMNDTPISRIAELIGDTMQQVMKTYSHFVEERQAQLDKAAEKTWDAELLAEFQLSS